MRVGLNQFTDRIEVLLTPGKTQDKKMICLRRMACVRSDTLHWFKLLLNVIVRAIPPAFAPG